MREREGKKKGIKKADEILYAVMLDIWQVMTRRRQKCKKKRGNESIINKRIKVTTVKFLTQLDKSFRIV